MSKKLIVFIDSGDTLVNEEPSTETKVHRSCKAAN